MKLSNVGLLALIEAAQGGALPPAARQLLARVVAREQPLAASGQAAKELLSRLKVHALEVHAASGRHELRLESWDHWARRAGVAPLASLPAAQRALEKAIARFDASNAAPLFSPRRS